MGRQVAEINAASDVRRGHCAGEEVVHHGYRKGTQRRRAEHRHYVSNVGTAGRSQRALVYAVVSRERLPEAQATALWLKYAEDMTVEEIARVTGRSRVHVRVLLHRGRRALAVILGKEPVS